MNVTQFLARSNVGEVINDHSKLIVFYEPDFALFIRSLNKFILTPNCLLMNVPLTHSSYVQRPSSENFKVFVPTTGSPRHLLQSKSMEHTLNTRMFTHKKQNLFRHDDYPPQPIQYITPVLHQQPEVQRYESGLRVYDSGSRNDRPSMIMTPNDYYMHLSNQHLRNRINTSPYRISPVKARVSAPTTPKRKNAGSSYKNSLSIMDRLYCCLNPESTLSNRELETEVENENYHAVVSHDLPLATETFGQSIPGGLKTPVKSAAIDTSVYGMTPGYSSNIKIIDNFMTPEKVPYGGERMSRYTAAYIRRDMAELEYFNSKLPEGRKMEKRSLSPKHKFDKFNSIVDMVNQARRPQDLQQALYQPEEYSRILRAEELNSNKSVNHGDPQPPRLSSLNLLHKRGDLSISPEKHHSKRGGVIFSKVEPNRESPVPIKRKRIFPDYYEEHQEMAAHEMVLSTPNKVKGYSRTPPREYEIDLENESTDVSEILPIHHTSLKKKLPTEREQI